MCGNLNCFDGCMLPRTHEGLCQGEGSVPRWTYVPVFAQAHLALDAIFAVTEEFWFANNGPRQPARCHPTDGNAAPLRYASYLSAELTDSANDHESPPQFQVSTKCHRQRKPHIDRLGRWFVGTRFSRWSQIPCGARTLFSIELLPLTEIVLLANRKVHSTQTRFSPLSSSSATFFVVLSGAFRGSLLVLHTRPPCRRTPRLPINFQKSSVVPFRKIWENDAIFTGFRPQITSRQAIFIRCRRAASGWTRMPALFTRIMWNKNNFPVLKYKFSGQCQKFSMAFRYW